jgi:hypothetical protein
VGSSSVFGKWSNAKTMPPRDCRRWALLQEHSQHMGVAVWDLDRKVFEEMRGEKVA